MGLRLYELHYNFGLVLYQQGDFAGAVDCYRQTIALAPTYIDAYNNLGCALVQAGKIEEAIQVYQQAIALQPGWATLHNNLGLALFQKDVDAAMAAYRQALALDPAFADACFNLGKALQHQGQHRAAIDYFQRVLKLEPNYGTASSDLGLSWLAEGCLDQALIHFREALLPQRLYIEAYCQWVQQLTEPDDFTKARISCGRFLEGLLQSAAAPQLRIHLAQTYFYLGKTLMIYGGTLQYQQAERYFQQALHLQPDSGDCYWYLAECLRQQGRLNAAVLTCHLALTLYPQQPRLLAQLGFLMEQQQQWPKAIDYYQQALKHPSSKAFSTAITQPSSIAQPIQASYASTLDWFLANRCTTGCYSSLDVLPQPVPLLVPSPQIPLTPSSIGVVAPDSAIACGGLNCTMCLKPIMQNFKPVHMGDQVYQLGVASDLPNSAITLFTAVIPDGSAWAVPQQSSWQVCKAVVVMTPDQSILADVSREYPGQLPGCQQSHREPEFLAELQRRSPPEPISGRVAALTGLSGHIYYHWMVDVLPRLEILRRSGMDWSTIDWFWLNTPQHGFQKDTLQRLGIPLEKVLSSDQHPFIQADQLIVPSFSGFLGWLEPWSLAFLRQTFLPLGETQRSSFPERIYISRANAHHRRVLNEDHIIEQLRPFGFVAVQLETMSLAEQIALFAQTRMIVAPHGGGLTNTIFCHPGTIVVELTSPHYVRHYYWVISHLLNLKHYFVTGEALNCYPIRHLMYQNPLTEDIWIPKEAIDSTLKKIGLL